MSWNGDDIIEDIGQNNKSFENIKHIDENDIEF